jgi:hypothetical protein
LLFTESWVPELGPGDGVEFLGVGYLFAVSGWSCEQVSNLLIGFDVSGFGDGIRFAVSGRLKLHSASVIGGGLRIAVPSGSADNIGGEASIAATEHNSTVLDST